MFLKVKQKMHLPDFRVSERSRVKNMFSIFKNFPVIHANLTKLSGSIRQTKNIEVKKNQKIKYFFLAIFRFDKPSKTASLKVHPVDKKKITFVCNEYAHNKPSC